MKLNVYSMHDRLNGYFNIFMDKSDEIAKRGFLATFKEADKGSLFYSCPEDYSLYRLGEFDTDSGVITALSTPDFLVRAGEPKLVPMPGIEKMEAFYRGEKNDSSDR